MNFEDLLGLVIFIAIVAVSSIFRAIKESKESKEKKSSPKEFPVPAPQDIDEKGKKPSVPRRKIIIRTEEGEFPTTLLWEEKKIDEIEGESPSVVNVESETEVEKAREEKTKVPSWSVEPVEGENVEEGIPPDKRKKIPVKVIQEKLEKIQKREPARYPSLVKPLYKKEITYTSPMEKKSFVSAQSAPIRRGILAGAVGDIPQLHWAIVMMELLGPPKSLRDDF
ncbi:MAG: hypothetical protein N3G21_05170 [Candidatus Hydrogenedentes bacterium]|nr:hypothetical protein [Candidatus Hydrogenedentota bacterium]